MKSTVLLSGAIIINLISLCETFSQYQNVMIGNQFNPHETTICINFLNPAIIVAGSNNTYNSNISTSAYFYSTNSGLNWSGGNLISNLAYPHGDPCVIMDANGYFYYVEATDWGVPPPNLDKLLIQRSTDNGVTWDNGTVFALNYPKMTDKPWGCVDLSNSNYRNNIYVTSTLFDTYHSYNPNDSSNIMFYRSTDGGSSFSLAKRINEIAGNCYDSSNTVEGAMPCTGPNGEVYAAWTGPLGIEFNRSTDGGVTWLDTNIHVADQVGGWAGINVNPINNFPVTACDAGSGPYGGNIYINWVDQRSGVADQDVWLIKSTNGGNNWGGIKRVNNDPPGKNQFLTWMTIDRITGYLYFIFYDKRNNNNTGYYADVYIARSTDGGETFQNTKVNTASIIITQTLGEYISISAFNNKIRPMWTNANASGNTSVWTAIVDSFVIGIKPISTEIPHNFELKQNYPNPFNPVTKIKFSVSELSDTKIVMYDIYGSEVLTLLNEQLQPGTYEISWDATNFASGLYFCRLIAKEFTYAKKMILIK